MKRFALPMLMVGIAVFGMSAVASAHPGHGGGPGHSHGQSSNYYGQSRCGSGYGNYNQGYQSSYYVQPRRSSGYGYSGYGNSYNQYGNGYSQYGNGYNQYNQGHNHGGIRLRTGSFGFGLGH